MRFGNLGTVSSTLEMNSAWTEALLAKTESKSPKSFKISRHSKGCQYCVSGKICRIP